MAEHAEKTRGAEKAEKPEKADKAEKHARFDSIKQEVFLSLWRTYDRLRALEEAFFHTHQLTAQQYNVLRLLRSEHPNTLPTLQVAGRLISRAPDITRILDKLEDRELIHRDRMIDNRRVVRVGITTKGLELLKELAEPLAACHDRQLGHLTEKELATLRDLLQKLRIPHEDSSSTWRESLAFAPFCEVFRMRSLLVLPLLMLAGLLAAKEKPAYPPVKDVRDAFQKLLERPRVPLDAKATVAAKTADGLTEEVLTFASEKKADGSFERVPVLLVKPANLKPGEKAPVVIVLHGTGGTKESYRGWLVDFAKRGIIGVAIDARYHGARVPGRKGAEAYNEAITRVWREPGKASEHPFWFDTCWDLWRLMDYLESRPDVDAKRIGMTGVSMGGIQTWLAASADERVAVLVPLIGVQSLRWSLDNDRWQARANTIKAAHEAAARDLGEDRVNAKVCKALWAKIIPGILDQFDCPSMLRLAAPRPLLILNGETDPNCPLEGAKLAFAEAEKAYKAAGASDKLKVLVAEGVAHRVTEEHRQATIDWCVRWLKPE